MSPNRKLSLYSYVHTVVFFEIYTTLILCVMLLIYSAWNECSENGACVIPTLGNGTLYVDAVGKILPAQC